MRTVEERMMRLNRLLPLLACPVCGGGLSLVQAELVCGACGAQYPVVDGIPVLLPAEMLKQGLGCELGLDDNVSMHPYSAASEALIEQHADGWVLDLGAGGKHIEHPNVVQMDVFRFPMADVVGSADNLPFKAGVFDAVVSQAVFEHLQFPEAAASEVWRVLKTGGVAKIDTAFLQPEHAYPHHYFNATEAGLRHWFRDFDIEWSGVEPYQHPKWSLVWFLSVYFSALPDEHRKVLERVELGQCVDVLSRLSRGKVQVDDQPVIAALDALVPDKVRTLAAGVSVRACKHLGGGCGAVPRRDVSAMGHQPLVLALERRLELLGNEKQTGLDSTESIRQMGVVAADRSRYLLQSYGKVGRVAFVPALVSLVAREARFRLPVWAWRFLKSAQRLVSKQSGQSAAMGDKRGHAHIAFCIAPKRVVELLDLFFSLIHQTHGGWALVIDTSGDVSGVLTRLAGDLSRLDARVSTKNGPQQVSDTRGRLKQVFLPNDVVLAFDAVFELVTLSGLLSPNHAIVGDVDHWSSGMAAPVRCHGRMPCEFLPSAMVLAWDAMPLPLVAFPSDQARYPELGMCPVAHIPKTLYRIQPFADA